ncbi:MAG: zinc ribbon-containing protein [Aeromonas sp.]
MSKQSPEDKQKRSYEAFIEQLREQWQATERFQGERLNQIIGKVQDYLEAASDLTQDELALIAEYVKRDLTTYDDGRQSADDSEFTVALKDSIWSWLAEVTDRTQVEWAELSENLAHKGHYQAGDWVGLGVMVCEQCRHQHKVLHPEALSRCTACDGAHFRRKPLSP